MPLRNLRYVSFNVNICPLPACILRTLQTPQVFNLSKNAASCKYALHVRFHRVHRDVRRSRACVGLSSIVFGSHMPGNQTFGDRCWDFAQMAPRLLCAQPITGTDPLASTTHGTGVWKPRPVC